MYIVGHTQQGNIVIEVSRDELNKIEQFLKIAIHNETELEIIIWQAKNDGLLPNYVAHTIIKACRYGGLVGVTTYNEFAELVNKDDFKIRGIGEKSIKLLRDFVKNNPPSDLPKG